VRTGYFTLSTCANLLSTHYQMPSWKRWETQGGALSSYIIVIVCLHFNFTWAGFYHPPLRAFEMIYMGEGGACVCNLGTLTRLHFHRCSNNYLFAVLGVLGMSLHETFMRSIRIWCWNNHIAMWFFFFNCNHIYLYPGPIEEMPIYSQKHPDLSDHLVSSQDNIR